MGRYSAIALPRFAPFQDGWRAFLRSSAFHVPPGCLVLLTMNGITQASGFCRLGFLAVLLLSAISLKANPVVVGEGPPRLEVVIPVVLAVLAEAVCIRLLLRRWRKPGLFLLWLMGMHLFTYPLFLGVLWLSYGLQPVLAVAMGEGLIVLIEGGLIYLVCRFLSSAKSGLPVLPFSKSLFASLMGNICSAVVFPLVMILLVLIASLFGNVD
jgi:hypothetical protein